jgi:hypothetical protein
VLCNEPFNLRPWEVERLTDYQIHALYLGCRRDKYGQVKLRTAEPDEGGGGGEAAAD